MMRSLQSVECLSRRLLLGSGIAGLAAPVAAAQPSPPAQQNPDKIATESDAAKHLTISVFINGHGPFQFVVDTGADRSVIADDVAVSLGLGGVTPVTVQGVVRSVETKTIPVKSIKFGSIERNDLNLPILPRRLLQADGYLGLDAIDGCRVTLDFQGHSLLIGPRRTHYSSFIVPRPNSAVVPLRGSMGHLRAVNCRADDVNVAAFIDTGAEVSVGNSRLFDALVDSGGAYPLFGTVPITGVTGGEIEGTVTAVRRIKLDPLEFADCSLVIADMQIFSIWGLAGTPAVLIGMNYLRQFAKVSIDYGAKELMFELASLRLARRG